MAVWQMALALVPRAAWEATATRPVLPLLEGCNDLWSAESAAEWTDRLRRAFGERDDSNLEWHWGDFERDDLSFSLDDDGSIESFRLRVDARPGDHAFVEHVITFAAEHGLVFLTGEGQFVDATTDAVAQALTNSAAAKWVRDPRGYLATLPREN